MSREIKYIIVHCSYTPENMNIGVEEIRRWHVEDNGWRDIGYHYVIRRDATVEAGRSEHLAGAHCVGRNHDSIAICLVGGKAGSSHMFNFTEEQMNTLRELIDDIKLEYQHAVVAGHNQFSPKACPTFRADIWYETGEIVYV